MFGLFGKKDPAKGLRKKHEKILKEAMELQRNGDIQGYAKKMDEANVIEEKIQEQS